MEVYKKEVDYKEKYELLFEENKKLKEYKYKFKVPNTGTYKIKLYKNEELIIKKE